MFITAREASGLHGRRWSAGWDTPASQLLTSSSVCLLNEYQRRRIQIIPIMICMLSFGGFCLFFFLFHHFRNANKPDILWIIRSFFCTIKQMTPKQQQSSMAEQKKGSPVSSSSHYITFTISCHINSTLQYHIMVLNAPFQQPKIVIFKLSF